MLLGVVAVEQHEHRVAVLHLSAHLRHGLRGGGTALDEADAGEHLVRFDGGAVVRPDLDVDADHPALLHGFAEGGVEDQRAAMGDAGLDDDVRLHPVDDFLDTHHVFGKLDDWPAHPGEAVDVLGIPAGPQPRHRDRLEGFRRVHGQGRLALRGVEDDDAVLFVDLQHDCDCSFASAPTSRGRSSMRRDRGAPNSAARRSI